MQKLFSVAVVIIVIGVLTSGIVLGEEHLINESKKKDFDGRLHHISCRIALTKTQIDLLSVTNSSIVEYKSLLDADYTKLAEIATGLRHKEFTTYMTTTFKENLKDAVKSVQNEKKNFVKSNLSQDEKKALRDQHKEAILAFANCSNDADKNWSEGRIAYHQAWITRWNAIIAKMSGKGFIVTDMASVVTDAQAKLIPSLKAVGDATKANRKLAMESTRNLHLHLWARFSIARIESYLKSIEANASTLGYSADVLAIRTKLSEASKLAVSGKRYKEGEFDTVWTVLRDAAHMLKELNKKMRE